VPLAPVKTDLFDEDLLGAWLQTDPIGSDPPLRITIFQFRGPEYYMEVLSDTAASKGLQKVDRYNGYLTMVEKSMFIVELQRPLEKSRGNLVETFRVVRQPKKGYNERPQRRKNGDRWHDSGIRPSSCIG
jgi:hypothetical protein